jgi:hypothetical protein
MKLYTSDNTELIEVTAVTAHKDGMQLEAPSRVLCR